MRRLLPAFWFILFYHVFYSIIFLTCRAGGTVSRPAYMEGREIQTAAGNVSGTQSEFCKCEGKYICKNENEALSDTV